MKTKNTYTDFGGDGGDDEVISTNFLFSPFTFYSRPFACIETGSSKRLFKFFLLLFKDLLSCGPLQAIKRIHVYIHVTAYSLRLTSNKRKIY